jgi:hypothetical protein
MWCPEWAQLPDRHAVQHGQRRASSGGAMQVCACGMPVQQQYWGTAAAVPPAQGHATGRHQIEASRRTSVDQSGAGGPAPRGAPPPSPGRRWRRAARRHQHLPPRIHLLRGLRRVTEAGQPLPDRLNTALPTRPTEQSADRRLDRPPTGIDEL